MRWRVFAVFFLLTQIATAADPIWVSRFELVKRETRMNRRPRLDATGNLIVFESAITSTKRHAAKQKNIYLYNRTTKLLKKIPGFKSGLLNGEPAISGNGEVIAYQAYMRSLSPSLPPPKADIVFYYPKRDQYKLVTPGWNGAAQDGECSGVALGFDGKKFAFSSNATNITSTTVESLPRVYLTDVEALSVQLMSVNSRGDSANRLSGAPLLAEKNNQLFYKSAATNLVPNMPLSSLSFHLYELNMASNTLVQLDDANAFPEWKKYLLGAFDVNEDGNVLVIEGRLKSGDEPMSQLERSDLFVMDRAANVIRKISTGMFSMSAHDPSISANGRFVAFSYRGLSIKRESRGVIVYDCQKNQWRKIYSGPAYGTQISANGQWVAFETTARKSPNRPDAMDIYLARNPMIN